MELFKTTRQKVLESYSEAKQAFEMESLPYHSTRQLIGTVEGETATDNSFLVFRAPQTLRFFSYGLGDQIPLGPNQVNVTEAETNLAKGSSTNGATDYVIEGFGLHQRGTRIQYDDLGSYQPDGNVALACGGERNIYDPGSILSPPQLQSPYNLEEGMFQHLIGLLSIVCEWDRKYSKKLGLVDLMPHGGGASMLRSNGLPTSENRYRVPEGLLWRRDGQPNSEFAAVVTLERDLVVPLNQIALPANETSDVPNYVYLEIVMRLYGVSVSLPTNP